MRISIVGPAYPLRGGIAHHVYYLQKELAGRNHDVQVISYKRLYPRLLFPGKTTIDESRIRLDPKGAALLDPLKPATWLAAARKIREFKPDLVLIEWWNPFFGPALGMLTRLLISSNLTLVFECHNVFPHERSIVDLPLVDFAFGPVQRFVTHSVSDRDLLLLEFSGKKVFVAPLPPPTSFLKPSNRDRSGRQILFFGMVRKYKGLEILLQAMPKVLAKTPCKLLITGEFYEPIGNYLSLIDRYGLNGNVEVRNRYVPNEEIQGLLDQADLLVMPYLSATQSGIVQMAKLAALPIVASKTGGLAEAIIQNETGLLCEPGDPDSLADSIVAYFVGSLGPAMVEKMRRKPAPGSASELCLLIERLAGENDHGTEPSDKMAFGKAD